MNIVAIVQARISSTRCPGKVMLDLGGAPVIVRMIERLRRSDRCTKVVVATTSNPIDDIIFHTCLDNNIEVFRGHPTDLLDRHLHCAYHYNANLVLKIPSDCPLIDYRIVDRCIDFSIQTDSDYASNIHSHYFPDGQDVEVIKIEALINAFNNSYLPQEREHTTPYIWSNRNNFSVVELSSPYTKDSFKKYRLTLDYIEDYWLISEVYRALFKNNCFSLNDIIDFLDSNESIRNINKKYHGEAWYNK